MITVNRKIKILLTMMLITTVLPLQKIQAQTNSFYVYFKQNDKRVNIKDAKAELKRQPFQIFIEYTEPLDLFVSASFKSATYNQAKSGKLMFQMPAFSKTENLESFFMNKATVNLFSDKAMIWKKGETNGDKVLKTEKGRFLVYRHIDKIFSVKRKEIQTIKDVEFALNLVFIYAEKDEEGDFQEIQRELVKIKWVDVYDEETKSFKRENAQKQKQKTAQIKHNKKSKEKLEKKEKKRLKKIDETKQKVKAKEEKKQKKKKDKMQKKKEKKKTE